jgi:hypothetical protein
MASPSRSPASPGTTAATRISRGGKLAGKVSLRFNPSTEDIPEYLQGDKELSSADKKLRAVKPVVETPFSCGEVTSSVACEFPTRRSGKRAQYDDEQQPLNDECDESVVPIKWCGRR